MYTKYSMQLLVPGVFVLLLGIPTWAAEPERQESAAQNTKPNILLLLADDLGYGEVGCYGQKLIRTPELDRLAEQGMRFTDFYAGCAVCSPSRAVLMTGIPVGKVSVRGNIGLSPERQKVRIPLSKDEMTLAEMLKKVGYQTAMVGKWHLDLPDDPSTWAFSRGFDYAIQEQWGLRADGTEFDTLDHWINGDQECVRYEMEKDVTLDRFRTNLALEFLAQRDKSKPFFLFMSYRAPHGHERNIGNRTLYAEKGWTEKQRLHAAKITLLDQQIGRLLKQLKADGELDQTLILFTSDNGPHAEGNHVPNEFNSAGGLRGIKRDMYEGGLRVPCIAVWKGRIKPGVVSEHVGAFCDVMPTLAEVVGLPTPAQSEGISFLPELLGETQREHDYLYWELLIAKNGSFRQAIRHGMQKAVRYGIDSPTQLFNLGQDIAETHDLATKYPDVIQELNERFRSSRTENPAYPYGGKSKMHEGK